MRRGCGAALLLALLGAAPAPATAGQASGSPRAAPVNEKVMCPKTDADADGEPTPSLAGALASLEAALRQGASPAALRALDASPESKDPQRASLYAAAALGTKRPMAALGLLLRAQRAAPQDPGPLTNLAAVANDLGKHREALALSLAAEALRKAPAGPGGLAVLQNNKGHALLELGKPREAQAALQEAIRLGPDLSEAYLNMAYALGDQGECDKAIRFLRAGAFRDPGDLLPPGGDQPVGMSPIRPPIDKVIDLGRGKAGKLPSVKLPVGPEGATELFQAIQARLAAVQGEMGANLAARGPVDRRVTERRQAWRKAGKELSLRRSALLLDFIADHGGLRRYQRSQGPYMDGLDRTWYEAGEAYHLKVTRAMTELQSGTASLEAELDPKFAACQKLGGGSAEDACRLGVEQEQRTRICALGRAWGNDVMPAAVLYDGALRVFYRESVRRASAAASYFAAGPMQELARLQVDFFRLEATADLYKQLGTYVGGVAYFEEACGPAKGGTPGDDDLLELLVCKPLEGASASVSVMSVVEVSVSCEDVSVGISTPGCVGAFTQVGYEFGTGDITIFTGVAGKVESGGAGASARAGAYVKVGPNGNIVDAGVRGETSVSVGAELGIIGVGVSRAGPGASVSMASSHAPGS